MDLVVVEFFGVVMFKDGRDKGMGDSEGALCQGMICRMIGPMVL